MKPMIDNDNGNDPKNGRLSDSELVDRTFRDMAETAFFRDFTDLQFDSALPQKSCFGVTYEAGAVSAPKLFLDRFGTF